LAAFLVTEENKTEVKNVTVGKLIDFNIAGYVFL
jgi:hypothetical protein